MAEDNRGLNQSYFYVTVNVAATVAWYLADMSTKSDVSFVIYIITKMFQKERYIVVQGVEGYEYAPIEVAKIAVFLN